MVYSQIESVNKIFNYSFLSFERFSDSRNIKIKSELNSSIKEY